MREQTPKVLVLKDFILFLPFLTLTAALVFVVSISSDDNNKGVKFFSNKDFSSAIESFAQAIDKNYLNQHAHLNLSLSQDRNNNPMKALDIYYFVANNFKSKAKFYSHFNQGELNGRLGKIKEALENYQTALEFQTKNKEIKENIEWLFLNNQDQKNKKNRNKDSKAQNQQEEKASSSEEKNDTSPENKDSQGENQQEENTSSSEKEDGASSKNKDPQTLGQQGEKSPPLDKEAQSQQSREEKNQMQIFNEIDTKAILDVIEKQETEIRARQFQNKPQRRSAPGKKDW